MPSQTYRDFTKIFMSLTTIYKYNIDILMNILKNNFNKKINNNHKKKEFMGQYITLCRP